jgi:hypothetical protein
MASGRMVLDVASQDDVTPRATLSQALHNVMQSAALHHADVEARAVVQAEPTFECPCEGGRQWLKVAVRRLRRDERYRRSFHVMRFLLLRARSAYAERYIAWCTAAPRLRLLPRRDPELSLSSFSRVRISPALLRDSTNQRPDRL